MSDATWSLIQTCWKHEVADRPNISEVVNSLQEIASWSTSNTEFEAHPLPILSNPVIIPDSGALTGDRDHADSLQLVAMQAQPSPVTETRFTLQAHGIGISDPDLSDFMKAVDSLSRTAFEIIALFHKVEDSLNKVKMTTKSKTNPQLSNGTDALIAQWKQSQGVTSPFCL